MNSCLQTIQDYGLRSIGIGERLLPKSDFTLCEQFTLIGSGLLWNIYFAVLALLFGFFLSTVVGVAKSSRVWFIRKPAEWFIFIFRGSPLFIQFFLFYEAFVLLPKMGWDINLGFTEITVETRWLTRAWMGALIVLILNTSAYAGEIFYGALKSIPKGDIEAADAYGLSGWTRFRRVIWPTMLRLAWPAYTNEAIFMFHATTLVYFASFPAWGQKGDALYYASYFADKTFNPFIPYPILAMYFIMLTMTVIFFYGMVNKHLNRHLPQEKRRKLRIRPQMIR
ncbi:ABC transporter permease [Profundibacter sp.]|uniref:ABC transporter permease n=1 Tax=Profundibacter sp. TaxID=3101071 RepID=UPI003D141D9B